MVVQHDPDEYLSHKPTGRRVLFKFLDEVTIPYEDEAQRFIEEYGLGPWSELVEKFPDLTVQRLFTSVEPEQILETVRLAQEIDESYQPPNFLTFFMIQVSTADEAELVARILSEWGSVEIAYVEPPPAPDPAQPVGNNPELINQLFLEKAPDNISPIGGVDARFAWDFPGGEGEQQQFIDIERGWVLNHPELVDGDNVALVQHTVGINVVAHQAHGTAVLGILVAQDNNLGGVGIARSAQGQVISYMNIGADGELIPDLHNALMTASVNLPPGAVMLVEVQWYNPLNPNADRDKDYLPVEVDPFCYYAIRLATAKGISVAEVAGNGGNDLDQWTDAQGLFVLSPEVRDSQAIIVGSAMVLAGLGQAGWSRLLTSNFGDRVDCFAWGEQISTIGDAAFGSTSGATVIVAGVALIIQGFCTATFNCRLKPLALRDLLRQFGTMSNHPAVDKIGVMPDLRQIIENLQANGVILADRLP